MKTLYKAFRFATLSIAICLIALPVRGEFSDFEQSIKQEIDRALEKNPDARTEQTEAFLERKFVEVWSEAETEDLHPSMKSAYLEYLRTRLSHVIEYFGGDYGSIASDNRKFDPWLPVYKKGASSIPKGLSKEEFLSLYHQRKEEFLSLLDAAVKKEFEVQGESSVLSFACYSLRRTDMPEKILAYTEGLESNVGRDRLFSAILDSEIAEAIHDERTGRSRMPEEHIRFDTLFLFFAHNSIEPVTAADINRSIQKLKTEHPYSFTQIRDWESDISWIVHFLSTEWISSTELESSKRAFVSSDSEPCATFRYIPSAEKDDAD